jgi:phosphoglycolate phosphatase-like HAD superfamily hydrolase
LMLGLAPVLDFDGTLTNLAIDWAKLRRRLNVERIDELWSRPNDWSIVSSEEIGAAEIADPIRPVVDGLSRVRDFAVLTSNDAAAVHRFVDRFPLLKVRLRLVIGRHELGGPKTDFSRFESGVRRCLVATGQDQGQAIPVYVGDSQFELDFARKMGMRAVDVKELTGAKGNDWEAELP